MPNASNVESPIAIVAYGRSGTSLLARIFEQHPDFSLVGETGNFVCDLWRSYEFSSGVLAPSYDSNGVWTANADRQGRLVRDAVISCFPDDKKYWCQKPIGVPVAVSSRFGGDEWDAAAEWYWQCFQASFPHGKFFTILRHPLDVVRSAMSYWGYDEETVWWGLAFMSRLLAHPTSPIEYAVAYDDLISNPEPTVRDLFDYLGVPFDAVVLRAFDTVHVPSAEGRKSGVGQRLDWSSLHPEFLDQKYRDAIGDMFRKFGHPFELPDPPSALGPCVSNSGSRTPKESSPNGLPVDNDALDATKAHDDPVAAMLTAAEGRHRQVVAGLSRTVENLHSQFAAKLAEADRNWELSSASVFNRNREWISALEHDLKWFDAELIAADRYAKELEDSITALQGSMATLRSELAWYMSERDAWQAAADRRNQMIEWHKAERISLDACLAEKERGITWLQSQCEAWRQDAATSAAAASDLSAQLQRSNAALHRLHRNPVLRVLNALSLGRLFRDSPADIASR